MNQSAFVLIEDDVENVVTVAMRPADSYVTYSSRGARVEHFEYCARFGGGNSLVAARDAAMRWIRKETDRMRPPTVQEREAGSRTP